MRQVDRHLICFADIGGFLCLNQITSEVITLKLQTLSDCIVQTVLMLIFSLL